MVWNLRNGVVAVTRDGRVAVMNEIAYRILGLKPRATRHRPPLHRGPQGRPRRLAHRRRGLRAVAPAQPRRAAAEEHRQGDRLHAVAGQGRARTRRRRDALLQGPDPRRAARGARAPARSAGRARRDGGGHRARSQEPARRHRGDGRHAEAAAPRARPTRRPSSPTSSRKRRWRTPSCRRCSTSCGRSACRSRTSPSPTSSATRSRWPRATRRCKGEVEVEVDAARGAARRSREIRTSCGSSSRTC